MCRARVAWERQSHWHFEDFRDIRGSERRPVHVIMLGGTVGKCYIVTYVFCSGCQCILCLDYCLSLSNPNRGTGYLNGARNIFGTKVCYISAQVVQIENCDFCHHEELLIAVDLCTWRTREGNVA